MDSPSIVALGVLLVAGGGILLLSNRTRAQSKSEAFFNGLGVVLVVCGLAVVRDGVTGSRRILWMLQDRAPHVTSYRTHRLDENIAPVAALSSNPRPDAYLMRSRARIPAEISGSPDISCRDSEIRLSLRLGSIASFGILRDASIMDLLV